MSNIVIGWDIGIKNLSYCILEKSKDISEDSIKVEDSYFIIKEWKDISLLDEIKTNIQLDGEISYINNELNCSKCKRKALYCNETTQYNDNKYNYIGYCNNHYKKLENKNEIINMKNIKCLFEKCKMKKQYVLKKNYYLGYCKKHYLNSIDKKQYNNDDFLKINNIKNTNKIDIKTLGISLFNELNKMNNIIISPNIILLENQPVLKNPTMKSIQMFLYSYYLIKNIDLKEINNKEIICYNAGKKLDILKKLSLDNQEDITNKIKTIKNKYTQNKKTSILIVEKLLINNKWLKYFMDNIKKDDLADSLLMSLHYLIKSKT